MGNNKFGFFVPCTQGPIFFLGGGQVNCTQVRSLASPPVTWFCLALTLFGWSAKGPSTLFRPDLVKGCVVFEG